MSFSAGPSAHVGLASGVPRPASLPIGGAASLSDRPLRRGKCSSAFLDCPRPGTLRRLPCDTDAPREPSGAARARRARRAACTERAARSHRFQRSSKSQRPRRSHGYDRHHMSCRLHRSLRFHRSRRSHGSRRSQKSNSSHQPQSFHRSRRSHRPTHAAHIPWASGVSQVPQVPQSPPWIRAQSPPRRPRRAPRGYVRRPRSALIAQGN